MRKIFIYYFCIALILLSGCALKNKRIVKNDYLNLPQQDFVPEIKWLYEYARYHENQKIRKLASLQLAMILSHRNNPSPDYQNSIKELGNYLSEESLTTRKEKDQYLNYLSLLTRIIKKTEELQKANDRLKELLEKNQKFKDQLDIKNKEIILYKEELIKLKNDIKTLDSLYLSIEKKKKKGG